MRRPRIKSVHAPERRPDGRIRLGAAQYGVAAEVLDDPQGTVWRLLGLLDGSRELEAIVCEMQAALPGLDPLQIREAIEKFVAAGFVEDASAPATRLTAAEVRRYASNTHYFAWVDLQPRSSPYVHQERLKDASATVLGLGGTGSAVAMSLAAVGLGRLRLVDRDVVEAENLTRQLLYSEADVGRPKAEAACERLRGLNPLVEVVGEARSVHSAEAAAALMEGCDLFVLCADKPRGEIQRWVNTAALRTGTPWILSAYAGPTVVVGTFVPGETPCYGCYEHHLAGERAASGEGGQVLFDQGEINPVIAPAANLAGHFAALEAIYFLTGIRPQTVGRVFHQNLIAYEDNYFLEAPFWPSCPACASSGRPAAGRGGAARAVTRTDR
jgi:molybdopterin/thiamine biosynthesis adenylyltransferase